jgi:hypothetical protein
MESRCTTGGAKRSIRMMNSSVPAAKPTLSGLPKSSEPVPPPTQPAATSISETPMIRMTVPVTIGGKKRTKREKIGASSIMNRPHAITDP